MARIEIEFSFILQSQRSEPARQARPRPRRRAARERTSPPCAKQEVLPVLAFFSRKCAVAVTK